ncbi:MAG: 4-phosphoerythronate dehydrogenase [Pseudomonadales bacterium]|nr:4-phosphoerythronate dehydrogenase [Pseudomonadales bacterium]
MQIIADANMPGLAPFEALGTVTRVDGRTLTAEQIGEAQVLLVRSVTRVDAALLDGTQVRFVGSATIGTDHVDLEYLAARGIRFAHAPGCNARAVAEYVLQASLLLADAGSRPLKGRTAAVVGLGNVGSRVADWLTALGIEVVACDPPLARQGPTVSCPLVPLDEALQADLISLHVPLTRDGEDATWHLLGAERLERLDPAQMLINTCRGPVIDNRALLNRLESGQGPRTILDVWESEPTVPPALLAQVLFGSPHIAGYSLEGKLNGTRMLYRAFCDWQGLDSSLPRAEQDSATLAGSVDSESSLLGLLQQAYVLPQDHHRLAESLNDEEPGRAFDGLRKHYPLRHELHHWQHQGEVASEWQAIMRRLFERDEIAG